MGLSFAQGAARASEPPLQFVRRGIVIRAPHANASVTESRADSASKSLAAVDVTAIEGPGGSLAGASLPFAGGARSLATTWSPGATYRVRGLDGRAFEVRAPQRPVPWLVARVPLEDVDSAAAAGAWPDAVVRFAPDSRRLALGTFGGWLRVIDGYNGRELAETRVGLGLVKQLAWSADGKILYAGEQSPDAHLLALETPGVDLDGANKPFDGGQLHLLWKRRLADWVGTSQPPPGDRYGVYTWPFISRIQVVSDGRLLVSATHSWQERERQRNASVVAAFDPNGELLWRLPEAQPARVVIGTLSSDRVGERLALFPYRSEEDAVLDEARTAPPPNAISPGRLHWIDARAGSVLDRFSPTPLAPYFSRVESWDSLSVSADGRQAVLGTSDGRAMLFTLREDRLELQRTFELAPPQRIGQIPIVAGCSYARIFHDGIFLQTQNTHVPFSSGAAAGGAPTAHRGANTLLALDRQGKPRWRYHGPFGLSGTWCDASGRWLLITCREQPEATEPGALGCLLFDLSGNGSGQERLVYYYPTAGPVMFEADLSDDGQLIAIVETPARHPNGRDLYGSHQLHLLH